MKWTRTMHAVAFVVHAVGVAVGAYALANTGQNVFAAFTGWSAFWGAWHTRALRSMPAIESLDK